MNFTLTTIFVLTLAAAITSHGGAEGRSTHANIRGRELEQGDFFDDLYPFSLSMSMSMPLSLSMSMSMPMDEELLVGTSTTHVPPQEEGQVDIFISENDGAVDINITNPDLVSPSADSSTTKTYIVTFADDDTTPPATRCAALAKSIGGTVEFVYSQVIKGCALTVPVAPQEDLALQQAQEVLMTLSDSPAVATVEEDQIIILDPIVPSSNTGLLGVQNVETTGLIEMQAVQSCVASTAPSWGLDRINQCQLPCDGKTTKQDAKGVMVYIMDTGIRGDHIKLKGHINLKDSCHFSAYAGSALTDVDGHGTHVAGTACGDTYGVSSNCRLCAVKVLMDNGIGYTRACLAGLDHIVKKCGSSLCVVNISIGVPYSGAFNRAVANTVAKGIVVVASAGNDASDACAQSPASEPSAITVGSIDKFDKRAISSNFGPCVDVYAPGTDITSTYNGSPTDTEVLSGTSMATPHVTGIAAAIRSANKKWNPTQVRNAIVHSARKLPNMPLPNDPEFFTVGLLATVDDINCPGACSSGKSSVEIRIFTDEEPNDIAWTLKNNQGTIVKNIPRFSYNHRLEWYENPVCLSSGKYIFTITDSNGDGICCGYGLGEYIIRVRGRPVYSGGAFKKKENVIFNV